MVGKIATLSPGFSKVYSSPYLSMSYRTQTFILSLSPFRLYSIPFPPSAPRHPLISSNFTDISEAWLSSDSTFIFSDIHHEYANEDHKEYYKINKGYKVIMFGEFNMGAKLKDCSADCTSRYQLQVRYNTN